MTANQIFLNKKIFYPYEHASYDKTTLESLSKAISLEEKTMFTLKFFNGIVLYILHYLCNKILDSG